MVRIHVGAKNFDKALEACEKAKKGAAGNSSTLAVIEYIQGNVFWAKNDTEKALQTLRNAIEIDPKVLAPYVALAKIYGKLGRLNDAILQYEAVLNRNPDYAAAYMALGAIYDYQGKPEKAEIYYREALDIDQDFAPAANNLAWSLAERGGNIDEALRFAQIAKEKMPKNPAVMDTLGWIYYLKGSYLNAIAELQDSVALAPDNAVINYHLGLAYYKNKQSDEAKTFLEKAVKLDPNFKGADDARKILNQLKG
jgi:tetratricopeptide (TPR) repeat protein